MTDTLSDGLKRAKDWPAADREKLAEYAREIEARRTGVYVMSDDERGLAQADRGEFASDEEMAALRQRFGAK
jgi:hypothetical protein